MNEPGVCGVCVYRREGAGMSGVVASLASGEKLPFHTSEELWRALCKLSSPRRVIPSDKPGEEDFR